jgi:uncharacterized protein YyaL (SSP411 family)
MANRLAREKSPYLLQHAHNPVDWHPWGEEAFAKAKKEDKPILLSIGYSTCHWCHVMERESFEDEEIARIMNERFVCVKLDREERPDVDKIYMTAVQAMTGRGGWPLNVFLTPELEPFFGGTYFPPKSRWGQPAWPSLLLRISELWKEKNEQLRGDASRMAQALREMAAGVGAKPGAPDPRAADRCYEELSARFDSVHKGFGGAPKFPMPVNLDFLLRYHRRTGSAEALRMVLETLRAMSAGGLYDQLGGGFARYSTDAEWRVPHFEKMLYDNAQLACVLADAFLLTRDGELRRVLRETMEYLCRDLRGPHGGFLSGEDADSEGKEGAFYVWTFEELGEAAPLFGALPEGNALHDPHGELTGKNVLLAEKPIPKELRKKLFELREKRPRPHLDDKVLAAWNGLALSACAKASRALEDPQYLAAGEKAADFVKESLWDGKRLWRRWRDGERAVLGTADDYACLALGLTDLYEAGGSASRLEWAAELASEMLRLFSAEDGGLYMTAADHDERLLARVVEDSDNVEPCAGSAAALVLLRLARLCGRDEFQEAAMKLIVRFGGVLNERPLSLPSMLGAVMLSLDEPVELVVCGEAGRDPSRAMLEEGRRRFAPRLSILQVDPASRPVLARAAPWTAAVPVPEDAAAFVCVGRACGLPVKSSSELSEILDGKLGRAG